MSPYVPLLSFVQEQKPPGEEGKTIYSTIQSQVLLWFLESTPCQSMGVPNAPLEIHTLEWQSKALVLLESGRQLGLCCITVFV